MTLHYHGLPLTPEAKLEELAGRHVCISHATQRPAQVDLCLSIMQAIMFDNGAFTKFRNGQAMVVSEYYRWLDPMLGHPHWAVVPDVIDGDVPQQRELVRTWPFPRELGAPVWHLGLPIDYLLELVDEWPTVCLGSSGRFWRIGSPEWCARMDSVTEALFRRRLRAPRLHGLRMMARAGKRWPLASTDSVNVARNYKRNGVTPGEMAARIDRVNGRTIDIDTLLEFQ